MAGKCTLSSALLPAGDHCAEGVHLPHILHVDRNMAPNECLFQVYSFLLSPPPSGQKYKHKIQVEKNTEFSFKFSFLEHTLDLMMERNIFSYI